MLYVLVPLVVLALLVWRANRTSSEEAWRDDEGT